MTLARIQRQAAASTDELLRISADIEKHVIHAYGKVPEETFDLQCRLQLARCRHVRESLQQMQCLLDTAPAAGSSVDSPDTAQTAGSGADSTDTAQTAGSNASSPDTAQAAGSGAGCTDTQAAGRIRAESTVLTLQLIAQNLILLQQQEDILTGFLTHSAQIQTQLDQARAIRDREELIRLQTALREELSK